jgi:hypothetical protein
VLTEVVPAHNIRLQRTVTDKVPRHVLRCAVRRRSWHGLIFSAVLTLLSFSIACTSDTETESASLIGARRSTIEFETGAFAEITDLEFMYVFNAGGTLTESSNYDGAPPVPPAYGVWRVAHGRGDVTSNRSLGPKPPRCLRLAAGLNHRTDGP